MMVRFRDVVFQEWKVGTWGKGRRKLLISVAPGYDRMMNRVGELMRKGARVRLEHRIVDASGTKPGPYSVVDVDVET